MPTPPALHHPATPSNTSQTSCSNISCEGERCQISLTKKNSTYNAIGAYESYILECVVIRLGMDVMDSSFSTVEDTEDISDCQD
ncbi:Hypothetical protein SMAX5B_015809 [Scophthalmus maximus]|uniref:Uncharacterized protein n=1 Tax=Scophthalmus maximus TaxID=52904 RepID=A0A2U9CZI3_SCOMX|nr:Hypothetical protein SMAX5B_015809 [Scophthalmus maximus]